MEVPSYFRRYLAEIQPSHASRDLAIQRHRTLKDRLAGDAAFQDCYAGTFLYGSYRRNTAIMPIKDVDVCVLLDIVPAEHRPDAVVARLRRVLERVGYEAKTAFQRRSVRIDLTGTTLDVVPVMAIDGADEPLAIPDRTLNEWVQTHPKAHLAATTQLNRDSGSRYVPFVKIVKAWYRYQLRDLRGVERPKPKGFVLEALVAAYWDPDAPSYAEAFVDFLANLHDAYGGDLARGTFPAVRDPGIPQAKVAATFSPDEAKQFGTVVYSTLDAARAALATDGIQSSATAWGRIFGPKFPTAPELTVEEVAAGAVAEEEVGEALDDEVAEVNLPSANTLGRLKLRVHLAHWKNGSFLQDYPSGGRPLAKNMWLRFSIVDTDVPRPYEVHWIVTNHGREAQAAGHMGHTTTGSSTQWESTAYRGSHTMTCELRRNDVVLARAQHVVNIRNVRE